MDENLFQNFFGVGPHDVLIPVAQQPIVGSLMKGISYPITVTTKVVDQDGNPLERVHLYLKSNPLKGATTNQNGVVTLSGVEFDDDLEFSYLGEKFTKMAGSILPTTKLNLTGWEFPETIVSAPKPKSSNAWWWLLGIGLAGAALYYTNKKPKYVKANL